MTRAPRPRSGHDNHRGRWRLAAGALAVLVLGVGSACSANDLESSTRGEATEEDTSGGSMDNPTEGAAPDSDSGYTPGTIDGQERNLIIRITVGLEVADVDTAVDEVISLAQTYDGELSSSTVDMYDTRWASGDLVFRLPPDRTDAFISALEQGIGRRTSLTTSTDDVTLQLVDLETRIENARASLDRIRALLTEAVDLGDVIALESELTMRQTTLEQLLAEQTYLSGLVAMSTVTVHLTTEPVESGGNGIGEAFRDGWNSFVDALHGLVVWFGRTLPFLVLIGLVGLGVWGVIRRLARRNRSVAPPLPPVPGEGPHTSELGS